MTICASHTIYLATLDATKENIMYKNYIFDVYGTLVDIRTNEYEDAAWAKLAETLAFYDVNYTPEELKEAYFSSCELQIRQGLANFKHPEVDVVEVFRHIFENKNKKATKSLATHLAQEFRAATTDYLRVFDGVFDTLNKLKKAGKKLYVLSNAQKCYTRQELLKLGFRGYFKGIIYSSDHKCAKPDATLFNILVDKYKLDKKECVYIGNDPLTDVEGARNAKIDCLWLKTSHTKLDVTPKIAPKYTVNNGDFTEVAKLLLKK